MSRRRSLVINEEADYPRTRSRAKLEGKLEVKRARNAQNSMSISLLPAEILVLIFLAVKNVHSGAHGPLLLENMDWVRVTHVCHHWRVVALKAPTLWTTLSITSSSSHRHWARLAIERSKRSLLSAYVECYDSWCGQWSEGWDAISLLADDLLRCRSLTLRITNKNHTVNTLFKHHHAPNLHSLTILSLRRNHTPSFKFSDEILSAPSLKHLELSNCCVDWHSTLFQSITYLKLDCMVQDRLFLPEFISLLSSMTSLQELDTDQTPFYLVAPDEPLDSPLIHTFPRETTLTNVDKITLMATLEVTTVFLSSFKSRPNTHIFVKAASLSSAQGFERFDRLLGAISYHFRVTANRTGSQANTESLPFRSLRICHEKSVSAITFQAFHSIRHLWDLASIRVDNLQLCALSMLIGSEHFTYPFEPQLMLSIFSGLPFDDLVSANIVGGFTFDKTVWAETFGRIAGLQSILLNSVNVVDFFDSLVYGLEDSEADSEASPPADQKIRVPFPSLDTVFVFYNAKVKFEEDTVKSMESVLRRREEIGKPVPTVVLILPERAESDGDVLITLRSTVPEEELRRNLVTAVKIYIHNFAQ